jgi:hypothetical protein
VNVHKLYGTVLADTTSKVEVSTVESGKNYSLCLLKVSQLDLIKFRLNIRAG